MRGDGAGVSAGVGDGLVLAVVSVLNDFADTVNRDEGVTDKPAMFAYGCADTRDEHVLPEWSKRFI